MKTIINLVLITLCSMSFGQSKAIKKFSLEDQQFIGTKLEQAQYLLKKVKPMGIVSKQDAMLPQFIESLMTDEVAIPAIFKINMYLESKNLEYDHVGGSVLDDLSHNAKGSQAKYFIIHDTSTPNFLKRDFPDYINEDSWKQNNVEVRWKHRKGPHAFVGRTGKIFFPIEFSSAYRATKFEFKALGKSISRGLFIHIELVQPRKSKSGKWRDNDIIAPDPGFTTDQYQKLALLYICASIRVKNWLVPGYHAVLDQGIKNGHDDPQNFDLETFSAEIKTMLSAIEEY
ncbi:hypothetical protein [Spongiivirga citrea]|uniref:Uncharacterized protein n=1 Tax=Spongiivirga citrea TaxID=1481457 RepID=A0A6M0CRL4_9FLAO|nr:hypothetical protein [Spongiivirga citrea]NER16550.1 hypothetical protein [Spongiivirga citrea]